jgi:hypothetical protein
VMPEFATFILRFLDIVLSDSPYTVWRRPCGASGRVAPMCVDNGVHGLQASGGHMFLESFI